MARASQEQLTDQMLGAGRDLHHQLLPSLSDTGKLPAASYSPDSACPTRPQGLWWGRTAQKYKNKLVWFNFELHCRHIVSKFSSNEENKLKGIVHILLASFWAMQSINLSNWYNFITHHLSSKIIGIGLAFGPFINFKHLTLDLKLTLKWGQSLLVSLNKD